MKKSRVIFCDYDGVLNDPEFLCVNYDEQLDPKRVALLSELCRRVNAGVVLTSTWRNNIDARRTLVRAKVPILGATPQKYDRGSEIRQWLMDKQFTGEWIIIDDQASELSAKQRERLVLTRENTVPIVTLGLQPKHVLWAESMFQNPLPHYASNTFLTAILTAIENDLLRVMWNIHQKSYENDDPFRNTGNVKGYSNSTFEAHAYDWNWDLDDNAHRPQPVNFKWRDFQVHWYKSLGRGMRTNRKITHDECAVLLSECLESLCNEERYHDDFHDNKGGKQ